MLNYLVSHILRSALLRVLLEVLISLSKYRYLGALYRALTGIKLWYRMMLFKELNPNVLLTAFAVGTCLPLLQLYWLTWHALLLVALVLICFACRVKAFLYPVSCLLGFAWASYAFAMAQTELLPEELEGQNIQVQGRVIGLPRSSGKDLRFLLRVDSESYSRIRTKQIQLSCYRCNLAIEPDQTWLFTVRLKRPHGYASWGAFDTEKFMFRKGIGARGYIRLKDKQQLLSSMDNSISVWRNRVRNSLLSLDLDKPSGRGVIVALSLGDKSSIDYEHRGVFQRTGVSHLMAISGLHVGLVFMLAKILFTWLLFPFTRLFLIFPRQHIVLIPALLSAIAYAALAGFAVSTQRAILMLSIFVVCRVMARDVSLFKVLLVAAVIIMAFDPFSILDVGFWLSCGAVLVIAFASLPEKPSSLLRLQPLLWLGMLPMTALFFGQVSVVSPLVNLLVVPIFSFLLIPLTLLFVALLQFNEVLFAELGINFLSSVFAWVIDVLALIDSLKFSSAYTLEWSVYSWLMCVSLIVVSRRWKRVALLGFVLLVCSLFWRPWDDLHKNELEVTLLDVGQGLAMVVRQPNYTLVYDTGPRFGSGFTAADAVLLPFLRHKGIRRIDKLIISHADNDHIGGFNAVMDAFQVDQILTSRIDKIPQAQTCEPGQSWQVATTRYSIIGPDSNTPKGSNNLSCVLLIVHAAESTSTESGGKEANSRMTRVLITGDIEKQVERYMLRQELDISADIVLVPHQGSKTSSTDGFVEAVNPRLALIAAGYKNHYGHPHPLVTERYIRRGIELVSTIESGSILLKINDKGWHKESYRLDKSRFWARQKKPNWDR